MKIINNKEDPELSESIIDSIRTIADFWQRTREQREFPHPNSVLQWANPYPVPAYIVHDLHSTRNELVRSSRCRYVCMTVDRGAKSNSRYTAVKREDRSTCSCLLDHSHSTCIKETRRLSTFGITGIFHGLLIHITWLMGTARMYLFALSDDTG